MNTNVTECPSFTIRAGGIWDYVSPSRLGLWLRCPLAFRFRYIDGIEVPASPSLFLGKMVHRGLRWYYEARQAGEALQTAELCRRLASYWEEAAEEEGFSADSAGESEALKRQAAGLLAAYAQQVPADEPPSLAVETPLEAPLVDPGTGEDLGLPLVGITDLVLKAPEGLVIVDFKTSARAAAPLEITHEIQLTSYTYLLRHVFGEEEAGLAIRSLVKTKTPQVQVHRYGRGTEVHFRRLFAAMRAYLVDLEAGRFVYRPGLACSMCEHAETHCRHWSP